MAEDLKHRGRTQCRNRFQYIYTVFKRNPVKSLENIVYGTVKASARKQRQTLLVSCKHWKSARIDAPDVGAFCAVLKARRAEGGFMVSTGRFSQAAQVEARTVNLTLIDGTSLKELLAAEWPAATVAPAARPAAPSVAAMPADWEPVSVLVPLPEDLVTDWSALAPPGMEPPAPCAPMETSPPVAVPAPPPPPNDWAKMPRASRPPA